MLIQVQACGICGSDLHFYEWPEDMAAQLAKGLTIPRVLGHEAAGVLREVGRHSLLGKGEPRFTAQLLARSTL